MSKPLPIFPTVSEFAVLVSIARAQHPASVLAIPIVTRLLSDQLTPVLAYRRLVAADEREAPSFLFESVEGGERQGRYSILGAHPVITVTATRSRTGLATKVCDNIGLSTHTGSVNTSNPLAILREITAPVRF